VTSSTLRNDAADLVDRVDVLGVGISAVDPESAVATIARWIEVGAQNYVCVTGMHGVMEARHDEELRRIHNDSGLTTPDGMPMVWAAHFAGASDVRRVYGPDLMLAVCEEAAQRGWGIFLYGGRDDDVLEKLRSNLTSCCRGLRVVGAYSPPFREMTVQEDRSAVEMINEAKPEIVWVGLSTPKQERWMASHLARLDARVLVGVGAAFDIHAGTLRQAPRWMQRSGLEWLFRLAMEPRRLWRRYVVNIPRFLLAIARRPPRLWTAETRPTP
jgi:N-acetylglucosaminyldiphosphoundecaprenol N-acetyl-beta-D-mannosaminyltransferase